MMNYKLYILSSDQRAVSGLCYVSFASLSHFLGDKGFRALPQELPTPTLALIYLHGVKTDERDSQVPYWNSSLCSYSSFLFSFFLGGDGWGLEWELGHTQQCLGCIPSSAQEWFEVSMVVGRPYTMMEIQTQATRMHGNVLTPKS